MWQPKASTRLGGHLRSKISHDLEGTAVFSGFNPVFAAGAGFVNQRASAKVTLPESASLHAYHAFNERWARARRRDLDPLESPSDAGRELHPQTATSHGIQLEQHHALFRRCYLSI